MKKDLIIFEYFFKNQINIFGNSNIICPFGDKKHTAIISNKSRCFFQCLTCNEKLFIVNFISKRLGLNPKQALEKVTTILKTNIQLVTISEALLSKNRKEVMQSNVQVMTKFSTPFSIPQKMQLLFYINGKWIIKNEWEIKKHNNGIIFGFLETKPIQDKLKTQLLDLPRFIKQCKEDGVECIYKIDIVSQHTVYMAVVSDYNSYDSILLNEDSQKQPLTMFTFDKPLENGRIYNINYMIHPNPYQKSAIFGVAWNVNSANNNIDNFSVNLTTIESLKKFQKTSIVDQYAQFKSFTANHIQDRLWFAIDLVYHSCLQFRYFGKIERGTMYLSIIGDSRTGKSATLTSTISQYKLGKIYNAKLITIGGLIGGSSNGTNGWQITGGILSNNHKGLIALEEIHDGTEDYHSKMTEVKSSGKIRLGRVGQEITFDSLLRIIEISNPKPFSNGISYAIKDFSSGVAIIKNLIKANEDIARQDLFILSETIPKISRSSKRGVKKPFESIDYQNRVLWAWSRKLSQIKIDRKTMMYCEQQSLELVKKYSTKIQIFGVETDIKVMRMSTALAAMMVSTDETYETIIVEPIHIELICSFLERIYNNRLFKIQEYVSNERDYHNYTEKEYNIINRYYQQYPLTIEMLIESFDNVSKQDIINSLGESIYESNSIYLELHKLKFIKVQRGKFGGVVATEKLRKAYVMLRKGEY